MDSDDMEQAMGYLGVAAHADISEAQYLLGSLLLNEEGDEEENEDDDDEQRAAKMLVHDAEANRQRSGRPEDAKNIKEIRKSARAAYKQYLLAQKQKKEAKAAASASVVQHATTGELDRAYGTTLERFLDPKFKLQPLIENDDTHVTNAEANAQVDTTKAVEWLRRAADNQYARNLSTSSVVLVGHDPPMAFAASGWYTRVTSPKDPKPHPDALYNLGVMLFDGVEHAEPPFPSNKAASIPFFTRAAEAGDAAAQFFMGTLLHQGSEELGIESNLRSGLMLIEMATKKGHPGALFYLAQLYRSGDEAHNLAPSRAKFLKYLDKAMAAGDEDALFCMADIYFHGSDGFEQNHKQAHGFYMAAAEQGSADAYCCLGALYYNGIGVTRDFEKAFLYYQEAADRDSMEAWKNLAEMYTVGRGVPKNEATAKAIIEMLKKVEAEAEVQ
ncbi:hypothetical protein BBJ28_00008106 [Nothophytophthora sp. Chile5]|nr:hypothetical protein BBJ28_00008106 [Nothophytophthora sp. Chile5]